MGEMDTNREEHRLRERNIVDFWKIKKTTRTGLGSSHPADDDNEDEDSSNDNGSYDPFDEDAPSMASMMLSR